jgi:hypothetical protein
VRALERRSWAERGAAIVRVVVAFSRVEGVGRARDANAAIVSACVRDVAGMEIRD